MANEISLDLRFTLSNGNSQYQYVPGTKRIDQAAIGGPTPGFVNIGTTEESVAFAELGTEGTVIIENLDATNYVQVGFSTGVYGMRIKASGVAMFQMEPSVTLYLKANTAACKMNILGFEN